MEGGKGVEISNWFMMDKDFIKSVSKVLGFYEWWY